MFRRYSYPPLSQRMCCALLCLSGVPLQTFYKFTLMLRSWAYFRVCLQQWMLKTFPGPGHSISGQSMFDSTHSIYLAEVCIANHLYSYLDIFLASSWVSAHPGVKSSDLRSREYCFGDIPIHPFHSGCAAHSCV